MTKFKKSLEELKEIVERTNVRGSWSELPNGQWQFRADAGGGYLNWWASSGTIQFQGRADEKKRLEEAVLAQMGAARSTPQGAAAAPATRPGAGRIFIVHGHDSDSRDQLELALRRLGLETYILMNTSGEGKTIIEALEGQIGRDFQSDFGIVLFTPDDIGYAKKDGSEKAEPRARQNVVLETGMLISSLTRKRMAILVKGHVETPSDLQGVIELRFNEHVREIVPKLAKRLEEAGIAIDHKKIPEAIA